MSDTTVSPARPRTTPASLPTGEFGRYKVLREIGSGGMGTVYAAYDPSLDRDVALKVLQRARLGPEWAHLLIREARALARVAHPNVIHVYDVGVVERDVFIAMELVSGVSLDRWLLQKARSFREILGVFLQTGRGLAAAHAAGLVHRDFKPENCLLGQDGRARVLDFGLARPVGAPAGEPGPASSPPFSALLLADDSSYDSRPIGTPPYMSPEQFANEAITAQSDQFAFAVSLWQALLGVHPFPHHNVPELVLAVRFGSAPRVPAEHDVPGWVLDLLRVSMRVDPSARHPSMETLLAALQDGMAVLRPRAPLLGWRYELSGDRARDRLSGRTLAVEVADERPSSELVERLLGLRHPNLARVVDVVFGREVHLLIDLPEGSEPLGAYVHRPAALARSCLLQTRRALDYLHTKGLVHGRLGGTTVRVHNGQVLLTGLSAAAPGERSLDLAALESLERELGGDLLEPRSGSLETAETRESLLQTLTLRGREREWGKLTAAMDAGFLGTPSVVVLTGESGAGKSRLLAELGARARARNAVVLSGQCQEGAAAPYTLFRDVFRGLALLTPLLDEELGVFSTVVPNLGELLDRTVATRSDAALPGHGKLLSAMLSTLQRIREPVVLLLDDVHWARSESRELLEALAEVKAGLRLCVYGTARAGEATEVAGGQLVHLSRLDATAMARAAEEVLGADRANDAVLQLIARETEGNAFFLVEALRALAEQLQDGEAVSGDLPADIGTQRALAARIARVAEEDRELLELAAVAGRQLDRQLLADRRPGQDLAAWTRRLRRLGVLETLDGQEQFSHDRLRETVEAALAPERRQELHAQVAEFLWRTQGEAAAAALCFHQARAGNRESERRFAELAGLQSIRTSAAEARTYFERASELETDRVARARHHRRAGEACYELADFDATERHFAQALTLLGTRLPVSTLGWSWFAFRQTVAQIWRRWFGGRIEPDPVREEASLTAGRLAKMWAHRPVPVRLVSLSLLAVNLAERTGMRNAYALGILGYAAGLLGLRQQPARYFQSAQQGSEPTPEQVEASVMETIYLGTTGQRTAAMRVSERGLELARRCGDRFGGAAVQAARAHAMWFFGHVGEMGASFTRALAEFETSEHGHRATFLLGHALGLLLDGQVQRSVLVCQEALSKLSRLDDTIRASGLAVLCLARIELGRADDASELADEILALLPRGQLVAPIFFHVPMACVEARLLRSDRAKLRAAIAYESAWVKNSPLGEGQLWLHRGKQLRALGKDTAARAAFERGCQRARELGTPVYEALCLVELGAREEAKKLLQGASAGLYLRRLRDEEKMRQLQAAVR